MKLLTLTLALFSTSFLWSQSTLTGVVLDAASGEPLVGAHIFLNDSTDYAVSTDFAGKYQIQDLSPGNYRMMITYIGYQKKTIPDVKVRKNRVSYQDVTLADLSIDLDLEVEISAEMIEKTENALLLKRKKSEQIQDGISAQEMVRFGVKDAAGAMQKVTGATVLDNRYVLVRGLGDRYTNVQLNGAVLPSADPYSNSAALDLVPTSLLDNIITSKSFLPDQPGSFTGGAIDMRTKSLPERFTMKLTTTLEINTQSSFNENFWTQSGGNTDWLGYDDGTRALPSVLMNEDNLQYISRGGALQARNNDEIANIVDEAINAIPYEMTPTQNASPLNHSLSFSIGDQWSLFNRPLGVILNAKYSRSFTHYGDGLAANWELIDARATELNQQFALNDARSVETPSINGLVGLNYRLSNNSSIGFSTIYSHRADISSRYLNGEHELYDIVAPEVFETRTLHFRERGVTTFQLNGDHAIAENNRTHIDWLISRTNSNQDEPNLRFFANEFNTETGTYSINRAAYDLPTHFFRTLTDDRTEGRFNVSIPVIQEEGRANKIKLGLFYADTDRNFMERRFVVNRRSSQPYAGDAEAYFGEQNRGVISRSDGVNVIGTYLEDDSRTDNNYIGNTQLFAAYMMGTFQVSENLKVVGGLRVEQTDITIENGAQDATTAEINQLDFLPSLNAIFNLKYDANIRLSATRTVARPNMRELAPFASFDFIGDIIYIGNPDLQQSSILNTDLRWEKFMDAGEVVAISGFYKYMQNPIVTASTGSANTEFTWENVADAQVYGLEFEFRKNLSFINPGLKNLRLGTNLSLIESQVDIPQTELDFIRIYNPTVGETRPLNGQSPYVANVNLNYVNEIAGIEAVVAYNVFGDRLYINGIDGSPDVYEQSRSNLDIILTKTFTDNLTAKISARNILGNSFRTYSDFRNQAYFYTDYLFGRIFGLSLSYDVR